ncbi:MAG: BACON domain-containing carbohydrate-binding protein [candidate division KSB1 bacterium]|nr:BACON domain-containing carbohydrate-binding protein [candidate division KSB1 bacterium]
MKIDKKVLFFVFLVLIFTADRSHAQYPEPERLLKFQDRQLSEFKFPHNEFHKQLSIANVGDSLNVRLVGRWGGGPCYAVATDGKYVYRGSGGYLEIFDVTNPAAPKMIGQVMTPDVVREIAVSGHYAYVADYDAGLRVIDVSVVSSPREVGFYDTPGDARGVAVSGPYAYVADYDAGLRVIDVSVVSSPREVGSYDTPGYAFGVAVSGHYAYVADGGSGLRVIDVSVVSSPREVGFYDTPGWANGVAVSGHYAYVADYADGLRVIDVSVVSSPREVGYYDTPGDARGVAVSGHYAYVADGDAGLRVIDVSVVTSPREVGFYDTPCYAEGVAVSGHYAYVADVLGGLRVIDVSTVTSPREVGFYDTPASARGVAVSGHYAYVADADAGLCILEFLAPTAPTVTTNAASNVTANSAQLNGTVNPNGLTTTVKFQYGTTTSYGSEITASPSSVSGTSSASVSAQLSGLLPNTTYHYRVVATNSVGTSYGEDQSFTTLASSYLTVSPTSITLDSSPNSQGSFSITSNVNWNASDNASWLDVSPVSGSGNGTVTITANSANISANPRSATVTVSGGGITRTVSVTQSGSVQSGTSITSVVQNHSLHQEFYIDIQVKDAQNLFGVAFKFNFPADKLEALAAEKGDFLGADPVFFPDINNSAGVVSVGISKKSGQPAANGTGIVARIKLKEKPLVTSGITIDLSLTEVAAMDPSGNPITLTPQNTSYVTPNPTSVADRVKQFPEEYLLYPNYPNPFNPTTTISYALPEAAHVQVQIFDINGREVKRLVDQMCDAGVHSVVWDGTDEAQQRVASGIYICRFSAGEVVLNRKLVLAK